MLEVFLPKSATRIVIGLQPINLRWGMKKLGAFCREVLCVDPNDRTCFLFLNARRDTLLMYFDGSSGEQILTKTLDKGSFLLPAPDKSGKPYVVLRPSMLPRLFRA